MTVGVNIFFSARRYGFDVIPFLKSTDHNFLILDVI